MKINSKLRFTIISLCILTVSLNAVNLSFIYQPSCPTDINKDGITNEKDVELLLKKFGEPCKCCSEDVNKDGVVNLQDLSLLLVKQRVSCECGTSGDRVKVKNY